MKNFSRLTFGAFALACSLSLAQDSETLKTEKMWTGTGLKLDAVSKIDLNPEVCMASNIKYYGCIKAFDALLATDRNFDNTSSLETNESLASLKAMYAKIHGQVKISVDQDLGFFKIISVIKIKNRNTDEDTSLNASNELLIIRNYEKAMPKYWYSLFNSSRPQIPYDALFGWIQKNRITPANESYKAGMALNEFTAMAVNAHDYLLPEAEFSNMLSSGHSNYGGIGMIFTSLDDKFIVQEPTEGNPAYLAGIHARDIILSVDDKPLEGITSDQVAAMVRGPVGTPVVLKVKRGSQVLSFNLVRKQIQDNNVSQQLLTSKEKNSANVYKVGYIKIKNFMSRSECNDVDAAVENLQSEGAQALVFDVRGNPGGDVKQVACTVGLFVGKGKEVLEARADDGSLLEAPIMTPTVNVIVKVPSVTLVDGNSASASEILAGSLQDYDVSVIVGARTFGKGSMQNMTRTENEYYSAMVQAKTIGRYYLPGGKISGPHTPQLVGIIPEVEVYGTPNPTEADKVFFREEDESPVALSNPAQAPAPRTEVVRYYNSCAKQNGVANSVYNANKDGAIEPDYQKLVGIDAAVCAIHGSNSVTPHLASLK